MRSEWVDLGKDGWADAALESDEDDLDVLEAYDPVFCKTVTVKGRSSAGPSGVAGQAPESLDAEARERPAPAGRQLDTAEIFFWFLTRRRSWIYGGQPLVSCNWY